MAIRNSKQAYLAWVILLTTGLKAVLGVEVYVLMPDGQKISCKDHTLTLSCSELLPNICSDPLGKIACPMSCDLCTYDYCKPETPCKNSGVCHSSANSYSCTCPPGWTGEICAEKLPCELFHINPCQNGGSCLNRNTTYECLCPPGFQGVHCQVSPTTTTSTTTTTTTAPSTTPDLCTAVHCMNGGQCAAGLGKGVCHCLSPYTGLLCETRIVVTSAHTIPRTTVPTTPDYCARIHCQNGGSCHVNQGKASCYCQNNFTGPLCEKATCPKEFISFTTLGCKGPQDVVILIPGNARTIKMEEKALSDFISRLTRDKQMYINATHVHVGVGFYNSHAFTLVNLTYDERLLLNSVNDHALNSHTTHIDNSRFDLPNALDYVRDQMLSPSAGARPEAQKVVYVVVESITVLPMSLYTAANRLKEACIGLNIILMPPSSGDKDRRRQSRVLIESPLQYIAKQFGDDHYYVAKSNDGEMNYYENHHRCP